MSMLFDDPEDEFPPSSEEMRRNRQEMYQIPSPIRHAPRRQARNYQRPPNWRLVISIIVLVIVLLLGLIWGYLFSYLRPYTSFTANNEVAQVTVLQSREGLHQLSVQVTRFDANGYQKPDPHPYLIQGDKVELKYEYVTLPDWLGFFELHSGYMLTSLQGVYNNGTTGTSQSLNMPDRDQSPLVSPQFSSITIMPGGNVHTLHISPKGQLEP